MPIPSTIKQIINVLLGTGFLVTAVIFTINTFKLIVNWRDKKNRKAIVRKLVRYLILALAIFFSVLILNFTRGPVLVAPI
jgi:amino acid permease